MPTYIALLRGINIGGHKVINMESLRDLFRDAGFEGVRSYIQSGNVLFESRFRSSAKLTDRLESMVSDRLGWQIPIMVRSAAELCHAFESNPFVSEPGIDPARLHTIFLSRPLTRREATTLEPASGSGDRAVSMGSEVYVHYPNGTARATVTYARIETQFGLAATVRNWRTVTALVQMATKR